MFFGKGRKGEKSRDDEGATGKRELSQSKIPPLAARLAQLPMGPRPLSSTASLPFALLKCPGRSISLMLGPEALGCLVVRSTVVSPLLPNLGPKI